MRVLFIDQYSELGGAQQCLLDLLPAVLGAGWEAHVAIPSEGPFAERLASLGVPWYSIPSRPLSAGRKSWSDVLSFMRDMPRLAKAIAGIVSRCDADLIYVNGPRMLPAAALAARRGGAMGAARKRPPLLFHSHNHLRQRADRWIAARAIRHGNAAVVGCCRFALEPLERHVHRGRSHLVYNGTGPPAPAESRAAGKAGLTIGVIGRIVQQRPQRTLEQLVAIFPHIDEHT